MIDFASYQALSAGQRKELFGARRIQVDLARIGHAELLMLDFAEALWLLHPGARSLTFQQHSAAGNRIVTVSDSSGRAIYRRDMFAGADCDELFEMFGLLLDEVIAACPTGYAKMAGGFIEPHPAIPGMLLVRLNPKGVDAGPGLGVARDLLAEPARIFDAAVLCLVHLARANERAASRS